MKPAPIDVIVPAYRGLAATRRCLQSVLAARTQAAHELVVIDDASPEPEVSAYLKSLEAEGRITLRVHAENRGFVSSVNEGMRLHPDRDVVLLNSDAEVADGWLDRLSACAARELHAGTVTPFSNNATICSYPRFVKSNALPRDYDTAALDRLFAATHPGTAIDIPTAVGFCMFIRRECLEAVGYFDEEAFGKGYGEEVDFCMRAARAGYRNLLAADTFVFHEGEVSFGNSGASRREGAQKLVDERYPEFQVGLQEFLAREPARPLRRAVDMARLRASPRPRLVFVTHAWGGGVEKHVQLLAGLVRDACEPLLLQPDAGGLSLSWLARGEEFRAWFEAREIGTLRLLLQSLGVTRFHFHHVHGLPPEVLELPAALGIPHDVTLHDYFAYCPQYHLADEAGRYCGEPAPEGCNQCLAKRPGQWAGDITEWRDRMSRLLRAAARVIAPSQDLAERVRARFPGLAIQVWPHVEPEAALPPPAYKVALLGGISSIKGLDVLEACVQDAQARNLPLHFRVIGFTGRPLATWPKAPLSVTGSYPDGALAELIALEKPDAFLFLSQVPESFSYTLTAALRTGLPVFAPDFGAFPERLRGHRAATLVRRDQAAAGINDALLQRLRPAANDDRVAAAGVAT